MSGGLVYFIATEDFSHFYIGSTGGDHRARLKHHKVQLRAGRHHCTPLQSAFGKYPEKKWGLRVAERFDTREEASRAEHALLQFYYGKPGCMNMSSNGLMPAQCPVVIDRRNQTLQSEAHRKSASEKAKAAWARLPEQEKERRREHMRAVAAANREAMRAKAVERSADPLERDLFAVRMKRWRVANGGPPNRKAVIRTAPDGSEKRFDSATFAVKVTRALPRLKYHNVIRACGGAKVSPELLGGYAWRFA